MNVRKAEAYPRKDTKFEVKSSELVYEKLIDDIVRPWFQAKCPGFTSNVYEKAMGELQLLKEKFQAKKKKNGGKEKTSEKEKREVENLPDSSRKENNSKGKGSKIESARGGRSTPSPKLTDLERILEEKVYSISIKDEKIQEMKKKMSKLNEQIKDANAEIENLRMRLSQCIGEKMRDNNPDIADLSDPFRPTELGTHFSELYDNEWSDAYEKLQIPDENSRVNILYHIVKSAFGFCEKRRDEQMLMVANILQNVEGDEEGNEISMSSLSKLLKSTRKNIAPNVSKRVAKDFSSGSSLVMFLRAFTIKEIDKTLEQYAMRCAELCWHMVVSDPPLAISADDTGDDFRSNVYRPYTKSDKGQSKVDFIVWPALYLHEEGPLISRGVAQPRGK